MISPVPVHMVNQPTAPGGGRATGGIPNFTPSILPHRMLESDVEGSG